MSVVGDVAVFDKSGRPDKAERAYFCISENDAGGEDSGIGFYLDISTDNNTVCAGDIHTVFQMFLKNSFSCYFVKLRKL